ncbi:GntR family transcriptional regulator [Aureimonas sp. AU20]|uniref:GntR family transcriptional regulator n=1 Tax=Aureimonas sp. AU20 TaxID=1349819 RepID=UPI000722C515|nr:GntR family transcriptional regulator [Aureimonas sp. AU20]ALN75143.1 hypothetical protein M673_20640 [Aureimonas sp. AU20]
MSDHLQNEETGSLSEQAYRHILSGILSARLAAGTPIQERRLAAEIGLSRSPLRDALGRLAGEGLLVRGNTGALTIRAISLSDYLQSLDMRTLVEPSAAALAARAIGEDDLQRLDAGLSSLEAEADPSREALAAFDDDLHGTIASRSGNPFMERVLSEMRRYTTLYESQTGRRPLRNADGPEHRNLLTALTSRNSEDAAEAMRHHLEGIRRRILERF